MEGRFLGYCFEYHGQETHHGVDTAFVYPVLSYPRLIVCPNDVSPSGLEINIFHGQGTKDIIARKGAVRHIVRQTHRVPMALGMIPRIWRQVGQQIWFAGMSYLNVREIEGFQVYG